jgi:hypothetical protein
MASPPENVYTSAAAPEIQSSSDRFGRIASAVALGISFLAVVGVGGWLMMYAVPKFEKIFRDFHTQLPAGTLALISVAHFLQTYGLILIPLVLAVYTGLFLLALKGSRMWYIIVLALAIILTVLLFLYVLVVVVVLFQPLVGLVQSVRQ